MPASSTNLSTKSSQRSQAATTMPSCTTQAPDNMNASATQTSQQSNAMPDVEDPSQRSTGLSAAVMNDRSTPANRWSVHKADVEKKLPDALKDYEDRRTGNIEGDSSEEVGSPVGEQRAEHLEKKATRKIQHTFFTMDYSHGFTGRGVLPEAMERPCLVGPRNETFEENVGPFGESMNEAVDRPLWKASDKKNVGSSRKSKDEENDRRLGESKEDKDVGPFGESRDEEEDVGPLGESRDEEEDVGPFGESRDEEDVGPFGEPRDEEEDVESFGDSEDDEDVGPLGESSDDEEGGTVGESREEDNGLRQDYHQDEEEEGRGSPEDINELMQLAASSVAMIASFSNATTAFPKQPQAMLTSSSPPLASTPPTSSRKRARDSEEEADDDQSPSQQKRMRMDNILGITRSHVNNGRALKDERVAKIPEIQQSGKRARSLDDDFEGSVTKPTRKRLRLYQRPKEAHDDKEEYITADQADVAHNDDSTLVDQDASSSKVQEVIMAEQAPIDTKAHKQPSVEEESFTNHEADELENAFAEGEAASTETEWDTAHGINSQCANIRVTGMFVHDVTGVGRHLYLPTSTGLPDRHWTEEEEEDLSAYIQDYGIEDWALLSQSTNRPEEELQWTYFETVTARNRQAGRPECAGIPDAYPDLGPPAPAPVAPPAPEEPLELRDHDQIGMTENNNFGDLTYDVKATSFPKITKDGGMVDSKGNALYGITGDISYVTKPRQQKPKQVIPESSPSAEQFNHDESSQLGDEDSGSEIEEEGIMEEEISDQHAAPYPCVRGPESKIKGPLNVVKNGGVSKSYSRRGVNRKAGRWAAVVDMEEEHSIEREGTRNHAPSPGPIGKKKGSLNASMEEEEDPEIKQEDPDQEQQVPLPKVPEAKTSSAKGPLGPKFAGVYKLSGSWRRGVPRNAAGLRTWSPE